MNDNKIIRYSMLKFLDIFFTQEAITQEILISLIMFSHCQKKLNLGTYFICLLLCQNPVFKDIFYHICQPVFQSKQMNTIPKPQYLQCVLWDAYISQYCIFSYAFNQISALEGQLKLCLQKTKFPEVKTSTFRHFSNGETENRTTLNNTPFSM